MCETVQTIYSLQLLLTICEILLNYLCTVFFWIHIVIRKDFSYKVIRSESYFPYSIGLMLLNSFQLGILIMSCSKTAKEVRATFQFIVSRITALIFFQANKSGLLLHNVNFSNEEVQYQV